MNLIHLKYIRLQEAISPSTQNALTRIVKCIWRAPYIDEYTCKRRGGILWENVKSATGSLLQPVQKHCLLLLLLSACGPVHLFEKRWMMPRHKIWVMLCTLWACINKTQDLCTSSINMCLDIIGRSSSQGKKKQTKHLYFLQ